jgi:hypothetical protein
MSRKIAEELLPRLRQRYMGRGREGRSRLIDEICEEWGYSRKDAIKLLGAKTGWGATPACAKGVPPRTTARCRRYCGGFGRWLSSLVAKGSKRCFPSGFRMMSTNVGDLGKISETAFSPSAPHRPTGHTSCPQIPCRSPRALRHQARRTSQNADPHSHRQLGHHPSGFFGG